MSREDLVLRAVSRYIGERLAPIVERLAAIEAAQKKRIDPDKLAAGIHDYIARALAPVAKQNAELAERIAALERDRGGA